MKPSLLKVIVTGATSDIGFAICQMLVSEGHIPILVARNKDKLSKSLEMLELHQDNGFIFDNDDLTTLTSLFKSIKLTHGKLDGLVCCAGYHEIRPLRACSEYSFTHSYEQNVLPSLMFAKQFSSALYSNPDSSVVFISSIAAILGESGLLAYSSAKGALLSATRSLAVELASKTRVNSILPGWVETSHAIKVKEILDEDALEQLQKSYPLGFGEPLDVAELAWFLLSKKSKWLTGQNIVLDGGRSLL